jgi:phosphatidylinositol alpha-1,6-mannosyltransferase
VSRTLVITNDFPPRPGGIQAFVHGLVSRLPVDDVVVYASAWEGSAAFDAAQTFPVVRYHGGLMVPLPRVARQAREIAIAEGCDSVWFGASAPLGLLSPRLRRAGVSRIVATTHGHEVGWAMLPGARQVLRRIGKSVDVVTYLGEYTHRRLAPAFGRGVRMEQLAPGVDSEIFRPDVESVRARLRLTDRPVVVCVSRLVARKGQDTLIRALPTIRQRIPDTALLLVGGGSYQPSLERLARENGVEGDVVITGSVPWSELPAYYASGDVFAMPCRTRHRGLDVEGLGVVYLEAAATGLPVVAGNSGGAPDAVLDGETGLVVDGDSVTAVAQAVGDLLGDPARAQAMGTKGRAWVEEHWRWDRIAGRLRELLSG